MYKSLNSCYVWLLVVFVPVCFCVKPYHPIFVDLLDQQPGNTISNSTLLQHKKYSINILNINSNVSFFVIQVHCYIENITLSYDDPLQTNMYTTGTNTGLVWSRTMKDRWTSTSETARFFLVRRKPATDNLKILLAVSTYSKDDPIPGGCNLSFETMIAPYQKITYDDNTITAMSQPPSKTGVFCNKDNIITHMYYMYLKENDNDTDEYFFGIQKMMTVESILKHGTKVPTGLGYSKFNQTYNLYRGTGRVFAIISTLNGGSSAYVPAVSFGCDLNNWTEQCVGPVGVHWKLICGFLLILGTFICFGGHRFFKTGLFTMGFTFGTILIALLVSFDDFSTGVKAMYSLSTGIVCGCLWTLLWWKYGAPLFSIQLTFLLASTLIASIIFYNELGDLLFLTDDVYFWSVFSIIVIITLMPIFVYPSIYHIVALSLLGSYAFVVAMNFYIGGNLPYILINTYRRIAVKNFGLAVVDPPYQFLDFTETLLWALLFGLGVFVQYKHSIGKAPFPPHRPGVNVRVLATERTPLIQPEVFSSPVMSEATQFNERTPLIYPERVAPPPYHV